MDNKRKPEWTPEGAGKEFASRVVTGSHSVRTTRSHPADTHQSYDISELVQGVLDSNRTLLSKAITLVESNSKKHQMIAQQLVNKLLIHSGNSIRIGITGTPGAGKSTFIESFGMFLIGQGHKVAALAIDPSSSISKGSILGDKTRMETLSRHPQSFIRPSPSSGVLGGVARKTRESIVLCEAAGYDVILIETVGVGQSEITVRSMVDFFLLMQISGAGDELQGIKKGIIELSNLILINKADGDNVQRAQLAAREMNNALHYLQPATEGWQTKAIICSALYKENLEVVWDKIKQFIEHTKSVGIFEQRRKKQSLEWFETMLQEAVLKKFFENEGRKEEYNRLSDQVLKAEILPSSAIAQLLCE